VARLIVLNNYSLERVWREVRAGDTPDHLLYGVNVFADAGWDVRLVPYGEPGLAASLGRLLASARFPVPVGDLQQQAATVRWLNECDLIYAACQTQAHCLSYLRAVGLLRKPIVCLAHHVMDRGRLAPIRRPFLRWQLSGTDAFPSLSRGVAAEINDITPGKSEALPWGPDAGFYPPPATPGEGVVAIGRTGRDFVTFGRGATRSGHPARIICTAEHVTEEFRMFGRNVVLDLQMTDALIHPRRYAAARAIAIPLYAQESLAGLSALLDALGAGRAVVMTRHPLIDVDIEGLGIGRWIEPGDTAGWADAITWFDEHPDESQEMGRRARALVDHGLNSLEFGRRLLAIFERVLAA